MADGGGRATLRKLPLFPGYVSVAGAVRRRIELLTIPGVYTIASFGRVPAEIPESEITPIRRATQSAMSVQPYPYLAGGEQETIAKGPLAGVSGFRAPSDHSRHRPRLVLSVPLISRSVAVEVDPGSFCRPERAWYPLLPGEAFTN